MPSVSETESIFSSNLECGRSESVLNSLAMRLYYQPKGYWFGDCMPFGKGDTFYLFHQRDTRKPCPFGEPFGWDLATTKDFVTYEDCVHKHL